MPAPPEFEPRRVCPNCRRPASVCYCEYLTRIDTHTRVLLLQHPRERDMAIGTARMANLCLPNSELLVGFNWEQSRSLARELAEPTRQAALLYPGPDAQTLDSAAFGRPLTLVVVDGTWANTRKMVQQNPVLARLPRVTFQPDRPSEYRIRREPAAQCVSTIEALMYVLGTIEGDSKRFDGLLKPFRKMVDMQLACKALRGASRSRHKREMRAPSSRLSFPVPSDMNRILCVVGEANAWPCRDLERRGAFPDELVQWVACRLATGECFECMAAPRHPLSPSTPVHLDLEPDVLHAGEPLETLLDRWQSFVRPDDLVCSWGRYATNLFVRSGGSLPNQQFDLRLLTKHLLKRNLGTMEEFYASIDPTPATPLAAGRAGHRLGQLARIARRLATGSVAAEVMA